MISPEVPENGRDTALAGPAGRKLSDLPEILASLPRLGEEAAASFNADIDAAREELAQTPVDDPWAS